MNIPILQFGFLSRCLLWLYLHGRDLTSIFLTQICLQYSYRRFIRKIFLAAAKSTLAERQERDLEMLESARQEIAALTEEKKLSIMGLNNTLADLRVVWIRNNWIYFGILKFVAFTFLFFALALRILN